MHRLERQLIGFCVALFICTFGAADLSLRGGNGFYLALLMPMFMWPFGMRH